MANRNDRDDFPEKTKRILQERVGNRCSNPNCRCLTSGPNFDENKATQVGVAAHITAALPGGPRFDPALTAEARKSIQNGIWLCQKCGTLVDADSSHYPVNLLLRWKMCAEELARLELEGKPIPPDLESDGYFCPHCDTFVKKGNTVCLGCHAEVAYGTTWQEWKNNFLLGLLGGFGIIFVSLPTFLESQLGWHISAAPWSIAIGLGMSLSAGYGFAKIGDSMERTRPPRFIRNTIA